MHGPSPPPDNDPLIGQLVTGRYRVKARIGEGGMGTVYAAEHEAIEKKIALKVLHHQYSQNQTVVERFKQEAISASRIKHPNVIDVFDLGQLDDGSCFIAMEFLEGQDLGDALASRGAFSPEESVRITSQIARALSLAHSRGVVHRDLKPENVFLQHTPEGDDVVKIVDFGIAQLRRDDTPKEEEARPRRLTKTGMIFGTPEYMAPEQARGRQVDERADVYSAGVILYELLSGAVPFTGESFLDVLNQHVMAPVPSLSSQTEGLSISPLLESAVMRSLAKEPSERFASMKEFIACLGETPEGRAARGESASFGDDAGAGIHLSGGPSSHEPSVRDSSSDKHTAILGSRPPGPPDDASEADEAPSVPKKGRSPLLALLAVAVLGAGGFFAAKSGALFGGAGVDASAEEDVAVETLSPDSAPPVDAPTDAAPVAPLDAKADQAEAGDSEDTPRADEPNVIALHVVSEPAGALLFKGDFQVCDHTPCEVTVEPGEAVVLKAVLGSRSGVARVLAQKEQDVIILLSSGAPKKPASAPSKKPTPAPKPTEQLCEVQVDGLKILRPCQ